MRGHRIETGLKHLLLKEAGNRQSLEGTKATQYGNLWITSAWADLKKRGGRWAKNRMTLRPWPSSSAHQPIATASACRLQCRAHRCVRFSAGAGPGRQPDAEGTPPASPRQCHAPSH